MGLFKKLIIRANFCYKDAERLERTIRRNNRKKYKKVISTGVVESSINCKEYQLAKEFADKTAKKIIVSAEDEVLKYN